jgi:acyl carrier protein
MDNGIDFKSELDTMSEADRAINVQVKLSELLKEILGLKGEDEVQADKGFFALGLDSLTSIDLKNKIKINMGIEISTTALFDFNTVQLLAEHIIKTNFGGDKLLSETTPKQTSNVIGADDNELNQYDEAALIETLKHEYDMADRI